ncbi:hypothetical protein E2562_011298 [Oryza meyeriana var. granulata]|uniref:Uncharacterized protein n=1 Tax=Oryza meyeriana var. granulata TaxID=110450 RepID=A0A6G1BVF5_9ORYZ|nr:hypothetical protein E2562_011298 [Oryza meyeriana var. granulata]
MVGNRSLTKWLGAGPRRGAAAVSDHASSDSAASSTDPRWRSNRSSVTGTLGTFAGWVRHGWWEDGAANSRHGGFRDREGIPEAVMYREREVRRLRETEPPAATAIAAVR